MRVEVPVNSDSASGLSESECRQDSKRDNPDTDQGQFVQYAHFRACVTYLRIATVDCARYTEIQQDESSAEEEYGGH